MGEGAVAVVVVDAQGAAELTHDHVEQPVIVEVGEGGRRISIADDGTERIGGTGQRIEMGGDVRAAGIDDVEPEGAVHDRGVADIGKGEVLDQRVDRGRGGGGVEGHPQARTDTAGDSADDDAAIGHVRSRHADLAGIGALVADSGAVFGEQA